MSGKKRYRNLLLSADVGEESVMAASGAAISECSIDVEAPKAGSKPQTKIEDTDRYRGRSPELHDGRFRRMPYIRQPSRRLPRKGCVFLQHSARSKGADVTSEVITSDAGEHPAGESEVCKDRGKRR